LVIRICFEFRASDFVLAMTPYLAILTARFRTMIQYRAAAVAGVATQLFFGWVRVMIFDGFYRSSTAPQPLTAAQTITYIWLGQAMLLLVMVYVDSDVASMIKTGTVAYELARPLDLYALWYARALGGQGARWLLRCIPIMLLSWVLGMLAPVSILAAVLFAISILLALLLGAALMTLMTVSMMWTISGEGVSRLGPPVIFFFSGILIPLPLLPAWTQPIMNVLPFRGLIDVPFRIYLGNLTSSAAVVAMAQQILWIGILVLIGRWLLSHGTKRLVVQGG
jgi:ABC-2 type transport system permease protein